MLHGKGGSYRVLYRMTNDVNNDNGNWNRRILWVAHYGYSSNNYMYYGFADRNNGNGHAFTTPNYYFAYYRWYLFGMTCNYLTG